MNKNISANRFSMILKKWVEADPGFRERVNDNIEKLMLAAMLKKNREKENLTQTELAEKTGVPQSVIARIEGGTAKALPRFNLYNRLLSAAGYQMSIHATKKGKRVRVAVSE